MCVGERGQMLDDVIVVGRWSIDGIRSISSIKFLSSLLLEHSFVGHAVNGIDVLRPLQFISSDKNVVDCYGAMPKDFVVLTTLSVAGNMLYGVILTASSFN